ncbi:MAG: right-handed parallel beta-helix repeat-containing protein [Thermoflexales bacterium]|nr:right-handed parallel beta-helix repeat-containing protein [Thermoflexales bacterium]
MKGCLARIAERISPIANRISRPRAPVSSGPGVSLSLLLLLAAAAGVCAQPAGYDLAWNTAPPTAASTAPLAHILETPPSTAALQGAVYYVAPTGNDANPGTLTQPWRTIQHAADTLVAGETVYIRAGVYEERILPQNSGSAGQLITYAAYPGETATVDGSSITLPDDLAGLFEIAGQSDIRLIGLRVINAGPFANNAAILISNSEHLTIQNCSTSHTASSGIGAWGSQHVVIAGNTVEQASLGGGQECITVAQTDFFEVRDNTVLDCEKEGIDAKDGSSNGWIDHNVVGRPRAVGIYVDAWDKPTHHITVSRNLVFDSLESAGFTVASEMGGLLSDIRLENNIAYHNQTYGIAISRCCSASRPMDRIVIVNNTLYENGLGWGGGIIADNAQAQHVVIRNNIVSQNLTFQIAVAADVPASNVAVDHNLIDGYRGYEDEVYGDDYVEGDPRFVDAPAGDLHLQTDSPAIDHGSATDAPDVDMDGDPRPAGAGYDIGADEWRALNPTVYLPLVGKSTVVISSYPEPGPAGTR